jgi:hypothetical protein
MFRGPESARSANRELGAQPLQQTVTFSRSLARALLGHTEGLEIMGESEGESPSE